MSRSGTSALARVLSLCGGALPTALFGPSESNPRGHWEPQAALQINDTILHRQGSSYHDPTLQLQEAGAFESDTGAACVGEIAAFLATLPPAPFVIIKEPRITALSALWFRAARLAGHDVATVIAVRHPQEVIASLSTRDRCSPELASALWLKYNLLAERHTREVPRVFVEYSNLLRNWRLEIARVSRALAIDLASRDDGAIDGFLDHSLHHQKHRGPANDPFGSDWICAVDRLLRAAAEDEPWDERALDRVYEAYRASERAFRTALDDYRDRFTGTDWRFSVPKMIRAALPRPFRRADPAAHRFAESSSRL
ncbi:sulfotransferase family protein [Mycobacterium sp. 050134]|uniref:sulfotransferase family protein n=1 Tax=Mycobacterium sp. 050134 TaxID=3096111 RepID=UPI002EDBAEB2